MVFSYALELADSQGVLFEVWNQLEVVNYSVLNLSLTNSAKTPRGPTHLTTNAD